MPGRLFSVFSGFIVLVALIVGGAYAGGHFKVKQAKSSFVLPCLA